MIVMYHHLIIVSFCNHTEAVFAHVLLPQTPFNRSLVSTTQSKLLEVAFNSCLLPFDSNLVPTDFSHRSKYYF